ncbi:hypothetical protein [Curtobacterium sp. MCBD17_019]|uniref:hypothetical protein n=1 Tax=Curtobacterium sp. MCBD17_019 TaxID=2175669 RepID=UPI000DAAA664|nr:hypothetical protein [Curtobacterium sp. MCBD17_019]PZE73607.1 hypothetical protein DEI82_13405 [Curtobacterium sp. MCBD17_019]
MSDPTDDHQQPVGGAPGFPRDGRAASQGDHHRMPGAAGPAPSWSSVPGPSVPGPSVPRVPGPGIGLPGAVPAWRRSSPTSVFARERSGAGVAAAALAIAVVAAVLLVSSLSEFLGTLSYAGAMDFGDEGFTGTPLGYFLVTWLLDPLAFYVVAFVVLAFLTPVTRRSPLPTIVLRAIVAGAAGTVGIMVVGVFEGFVHAVSELDWTYLLTDILTDPLSRGVEYTALTITACTLVWLWSGRPGRRGRPGMPGMVPPADAVPVATIPPQAPAWHAAAPRPGASQSGGAWPTGAAQPGGAWPTGAAQPGGAWTADASRSGGPWPTGTSAPEEWRATDEVDRDR